jgi:hypothetical protein
VGPVVIGALLTETDRSLYVDIQRAQGTSLPTLQELRGSAWYLILLGVALALGIGGALWMYWSWWYTRWRRWMRLDTVTAPKRRRQNHRSTTGSHNGRRASGASESF